ncbi:MAG: prolyl oligopeptidase family serine peptidase [Bryobacteraceae bacterium]|nr:prolyl oligopeptidase family serine peptidase [Bryobacteraceae bacterium]
MRLFSALLLIAVSAWAQDAGLVLSTYVNYVTEISSASLSPEKRAELDAAARTAMGLNAQKQHGEALRILHRGLAEMRGFTWSPARAFATGLVFRADHAVWEPGQKVRLSAKRLYPNEPGAPESTRAVVALGDTQLGDWVISGDSAQLMVTVPAGVASGNGIVNVQVPPLQVPKTIAVAIQPGLRARAESLSARVAKLTTQPGTALWTAQYGPELFRRVDVGELALANFDLAKEIADGQALVTRLEAGERAIAPAAARDMRFAYLSNVDNTLQPYRLYLPKTWRAGQSYPLVMALHGMGGDENTLFARYGERVMLNEADKQGFIVAAPKGRQPASMYRDAAEQDVLDVLKQVRADYSIDNARIYMMGHSMGAYGTWSIAMAHPELFAALGPIAGGGDPAGMEKIRTIPQIVIHGDNDKTVAVTQSRMMVEAAKKLGVLLEYVEVPGGSHNGVAAPAFGPIFSFFAAHPKKAAAGAGN